MIQTRSCRLVYIYQSTPSAYSLFLRKKLLRHHKKQWISFPHYPKNWSSILIFHVLNKSFFQIDCWIFQSILFCRILERCWRPVLSWWHKERDDLGGSNIWSEMAPQICSYASVYSSSLYFINKKPCFQAFHFCLDVTHQPFTVLKVIRDRFAQCLNTIGTLIF